MNYNPLLPSVRENPYPYYVYLRQHAPVYWVEPMQCWAISRYADVDAEVERRIDLNPVAEQSPQD